MIELKDLENLAKAVAMNILEDDAREAFLNATEEFRVELVKAYLEAQIKKTEKLQTLYLTNPTFRNEFRKLIYKMCGECVNRKEQGRAYRPGKAV